jgi:hypothetical protein
MKLLLKLLLASLLWSPAALALTPELQADLERVGTDLKTQREAFDKMIADVKTNTRASRATEPSPEDDGRIAGGLTNLKTAVQAMVDVMTANAAPLKAEDASFDDHLGTFKDNLKDLDEQITDAKNQHYIKHLHHPGIRKVSKFH